MNTPNKVESPREVARIEPSYVTPTVDITEGKDEYRLEADMPGVTKTGIEVLLEDNELTLIGHRQPPLAQGEILHQESSRLDYRRTFVLEPVIDLTKISAQIDQGVLTVRLPKAQKMKPRKIDVTD